jgi:DNA-binding beta-propeller fold protein YncE
MKNKSILITIILILSFFANISCGQNKQTEETSNLKYLGNITAPEFPKNAEWLNTDRPITLKELQGKLVLLDFWTYCCINCMHIIPDLKKLEQKYKNELVVIGVHSAKFLTERGTDNIRNAILRYEIEHPVINDKDLQVWDSYSAHAWPTLILIDPKGKIIKVQTGEGIYDEFDGTISSAIEEYDKAGGILNREPVKFSLEKEKITRSLFSFPGKITADVLSSRLFITDSDNNRVVILKINENNKAEVEEVIGSGNIGKKDGNFSEAEFFHPQGITFQNDILYVADTENHLLREINLKSKHVKTIAGTGLQSKSWGSIRGTALETALNSPWDVVCLNDALYIAMAGAHQIWKMDLKTNEIGTYAGSGMENIVDGELKSAALAQTSGITTDGTKLYFADSEVSAIRSAGLGTDGKIKTIVGQGLFEFGDVDGKGSKVRLQHPLGIVYNPADKLLYVADTYNSKIKVINPVSQESTSYSGTGVAGDHDGTSEAQFNEPSGLTILNGKIYITDTNNHLIRVIDMASREVKTLVMTNPEKLTKNIRSETRIKQENIIKLEKINLSSGESILQFNFLLPKGYHINPEAMPQISISSPENLLSPFEKEIETKEPNFDLPVKLNPGNGYLDIELLIYYCDTENEGICKFKDLYFELPVNTESQSQTTAKIDYTLN